MDNRSEAVAQYKLAEMMDNSPHVLQQRALSDAIHREVKPNHTGLPDRLKSGIESLSGMSMDHVRVHYNSDKPAQLQAHAFAQGSEIHVGPGQERHLPHEAWHIVQQAQGRVRPTLQMKAVAVNDDPSLEQEADMMGRKAAQLAGDHDARNRVAAGLVAGFAGPARTLQRKVALLSNGIGGGVAGAAPVQRVLNRLPAQVNGPNGLKDVYADSDDGVHYRRTVGGAGTQINLLEVTIGADGRYAAVAGAVPRLMDTATGTWVAAVAPVAAVGGAGGAGAPAVAAAAAPVVAVAPVAVAAPVAAPPAAWTTQQGIAAGFTHRAGAHYQRDSPDFNGYHVHASFHHNAQRFTKFHIKFDTGGEHVSLFYRFGAGAAFDHYGQSLPVRRAIVAAFSHAGAAAGPATTAQADATLASMEAHANGIAAAIIALL